MRPRGVLLDFDGVIADTENHHIAAWQRTLSAIGWEVSDEVCLKAMEQDDRVFLAELFERQQIKGGDVEGWVRKKQALTRTLLADSPRVYPGVVPLVERLRGQIVLGIVTTTWRENVLAVLDAVGLRPSFALILAKEDVTVPKPDPECYRRAMQCLSLRPEDAVALEDSPGGLAAARGAGLHVVAVGHRRPHGDWVGDAPFLADFRTTDAVLAALGLEAAG
jgi:beta-phosphoglucomutase